MYIILINILITYFYLVLRFKKNLHILQQNFYNENNRYIKWGNKNILSVFKYDLILLVLNIINLFVNSKILLFVNIFYLVLFFVEKNNINKEQVKIPLKLTSRVKRMIVTNIILYIVPIVIYLFNKDIYIFNFVYSLLISLNFYIVFLSNVINKPVEKCVFLYYKNKAMNKIKSMSN